MSVRRLKRDGESMPGGEKDAKERHAKPRRARQPGGSAAVLNGARRSNKLGEARASTLQSWTSASATHLYIYF